MNPPSAAVHTKDNGTDFENGAQNFFGAFIINREIIGDLTCPGLMPLIKNKLK